MSKKKQEWNPLDTMSEEYMKSVKSDVDFGEAIANGLNTKLFPFKCNFKYIFSNGLCNQAVIPTI